MVPCRGFSDFLLCSIAKTLLLVADKVYLFIITYITGWGRSGVVVSTLHFRSEGRWFDTSPCHRIVSLDKKLYPTFVSLHPGV